MNKITTRHLIIIAAIITLLLVIFAIQSVRIIQANAREELGESLTTVLETSNQAIHSWVGEQKATVEIWANSPEIVAFTEELLTIDPTHKALVNSPLQEEVREFLFPVHQGREYQGFFILNIDNISISSSRNINLGIPNPLASQEMLFERIVAGEARMSVPMPSDVPIFDEDGVVSENTPTMFVAAPIRNNAGEIIGILSFRISPWQDFTSLLQRGRLGSSGETYAFDLSGHLISKSRFDEHLLQVGLIDLGESAILNVEIRDPGVNLLEAGIVTLPTEELPLTLMASSAIAGESGINLDGYRDYRGVPVVGAWLWDEELDFGMTTEIDVSEAYQSFNFTRLIIIIFTVLSIILITILAVIFIYSREIILESETKYRLINEHAIDGIIHIDEQGIIIGWNMQAEAIFGWSAEEVMGSELGKLIIPAQHRENHKHAFEKYLDTRIPHIIGQHIEIEGLHKDGHEIDLELSITPVELRGKLIFSGFVRDLTREKEAEKAHRRTAERFANILQIAPSAILSLDEEHKIVQFNNSAEKLFQYSAEEIMGKTLDRLLPLEYVTSHRELVQDFSTSLKDFRKSEFRDEMVGQAKDGSVFPLEISITKHIDESGVILIAIINDITVRKEAQRLLEQTNKELEFRVEERTHQLSSAVKELEAFSYSVSHDLRAPLRWITGFSEILETDFSAELSEEAKGHISKIRRSSKKMDHMIHGLLKLSGLGQQTQNLRPVDLDALANKVFADVQKKDTGRLVKFTANTQKIVSADEQMLIILFNNLIGNAIKYSKNETRAIIELGVEDQGEKQVFYLKDNGVGFDMDFAKNIFAPFQRLHTNREFEGHGIGLALVQRVVAYHQGEIWYESQVGEGTTFFFTLDG